MREIYLDRGRAESFGAVAADYDAYRPSYPDGLISDLVELAPARALDVACGTGKVAVALVACGIAVLGVEIDPHMAAVARSHGLIVEEGKFETWGDQGRTFDLITCGQGWHWIDPGVGGEKAARLLNPGGTLALFWNRDRFDDDVQAELNQVYETCAPQLAEHDRGHGDDPVVAELRETGKFAAVETRSYKWLATLTTEQLIGRTGTYSDHLALPEQTRTALFGAMREVLDARGGSVTVHFKTYTIFARTPE
ncbi:MAG TPA: methyltransferase domain-containing protein [Jatrophihabitans sp.]|jgi:SAM-dependent methyltransferase